MFQDFVVYVVLTFIKEATLVYKGIVTVLQGLVRQNFPAEQIDNGVRHCLQTVAPF